MCIITVVSLIHCVTNWSEGAGEQRSIWGSACVMSQRERVANNRHWNPLSAPHLFFVARYSFWRDFKRVEPGLILCTTRSNIHIHSAAWDTWQPRAEPHADADDLHCGCLGLAPNLITTSARLHIGASTFSCTTFPLGLSGSFLIKDSWGRSPEPTILCCQRYKTISLKRLKTTLRQTDRS